jgi:hypothetical protein
MNLDPLQRLVVNRPFLNPKPKNWRMVVALACVVIIGAALLLVG